MLPPFGQQPYRIEPCQIWTSAKVCHLWALCSAAMADVEAGIGSTRECTTGAARTARRLRDAQLALTLAGLLLAFDCGGGGNSSVPGPSTSSAVLPSGKITVWQLPAESNTKVPSPSQHTSFGDAIDCDICGR